MVVSIGGGGDDDEFWVWNLEGTGFGILCGWPRLDLVWLVGF